MSSIPDIFSAITYILFPVPTVLFSVANILSSVATIFSTISYIFFLVAAVFKFVKGATIMSGITHIFAWRRCAESKTFGRNRPRRRRTQSSPI